MIDYLPDKGESGESRGDFYPKFTWFTIGFSLRVCAIKQAAYVCTIIRIILGLGKDAFGFREKLGYWPKDVNLRSTIEKLSIASFVRFAAHLNGKIFTPR